MSEIVPIEALKDSGAGHGEEKPVLKGDLTQGPILKTLVLFSIPALVTNVLQSLSGSINSIWVGRLIGESALAATANANVVMFLMFSMVFGFGMSTTVRVGQHFGARNLRGARRTFGSGLGFCFLLSSVIAVIGWFASPYLLHLLATPRESLSEARAYLQVIFAILPLTALNMIMAMGLRGTGDSRTPLQAMVLTVLLDAGLNPLLIRGLGPIPGFGIAGSAAATGFANICGVTLMIVKLYWRDLPLRLLGIELAYLLPRRRELAYVLGKGVPMGVQMLLFSLSQVVMIGLVNREGLNTTAAYGASMQLWNYLQMPAMAIGMAISSMVAQNIGAGHHDRVGAITRVGMWTNLAMTGGATILIVLFDHALLAMFLGWDSPAVPIGRHIQLICTWSFVLAGANMVLNATMRAYGAVVLPLIIMTIALYPVRLGFYYAAFPLIGSEALWWSFTVGSVAMVGLNWWVYNKGTWRKRAAAAIRS